MLHKINTRDSTREEYTHVNVKKIVRYILVNKDGGHVGTANVSGYETAGEAELAREIEEDTRCKRWDKYAKTWQK